MFGYLIPRLMPHFIETSEEIIVLIVYIIVKHMNVFENQGT